MKTTTVLLLNIKDPDVLPEMFRALGKRKCSEYADLEIVVDENLNIIGGKVVRR